MTGSADDVIAASLAKRDGFEGRVKPYHSLEAKSFRSALKQAGFAIVPVEPTEEMLMAVIDEFQSASVHEIWKDMLSAARQQEAQDDG